MNKPSILKTVSISEMLHMREWAYPMQKLPIRLVART